MLRVKEILQTNAKILVIFILLLFIVSACNLFNGQPATGTKDETDIQKEQKKEQVSKKEETEVVNPEGKVLFTIDFAQDSKEDARKWLKENSFNFESDAKSQNKLALSFENESLVLNAKSKLFGLIINGKLHVENANFIRITWGVRKYPNGASYMYVLKVLTMNL